ncbi:putative terminase large subunit [Lactococcus phage 1358]|uniref:Putative terminase large subunit n=1 Tax=Lactococcus phage 1358 TaxID=741942 RepID=D3W0D3_9CAUD|nr:terminase large subunit [Lactococcus phage 1358]ADD25699.1 putative terminase large subunit [Lactococcus phage 1358]
MTYSQSSQQATATTARPKIEITFSINNLISPDFAELHNKVTTETNELHNWLKGGRGSLKSSYIGTEIVLGIMEDPLAHAYVFRKVGDTCRGSVFNEYQKIIARLPDSMQANWKRQLNPLQLVYTNPDTGHEQFILFKGGDNPRKVKSATFPQGFVRFIHYEEADEFESPQDFRTINASLLRGSDDITPAVFYSYNPPKIRGHWLNEHVRDLTGTPMNYVSHTNFLTCYKLHPEWLGKTFLAEAFHTMKYNRRQFDWEYLGLDVATGNEVFNNIESRVITQEERDNFEDYRKSGVDFGFSKDPFVYVDAYFDRKRDTVYLWNEVFQTRLKNKAAVEKVKSRNPSTYKGGARGRLIKADAAEPRTISEFYDLGLDITRSKKGKGSVDHGVKWLSDRTKIIIDTGSKNVLREFSRYAILSDEHGNARGGYPDKDNHTIDAVRYALEDEIKGSGFDYD